MSTFKYILDIVGSLSLVAYIVVSAIAHRLQNATIEATQESLTTMLGVLRELRTEVDEIKNRSSV